MSLSRGVLVMTSIFQDKERLKTILKKFGGPSVHEQARFKGRVYEYIHDAKGDGPLATKGQYDNFQDSSFYVRGEDVWRYHTIVGKKSEVEILPKKGGVIK